MDLQLPGEQWPVGTKASEQDSLLACPGGDVKQQQGFLCPFCLSVTCCHTCRGDRGGGTDERAHVTCGIVPSPSCWQPSPAVPAQPKATPQEASTRQPRPAARQRDGPDDAAAKIRATKMLTCPSLATLAGRRSLSLPAPGVGGEASKCSQMHSRG